MLRLAAHVEQLAPASAEQLDRRFVGRELVSRQQINRRHRFQRALAVDVEQPQAVDLVVEKVDAVGLLAAHWKEIEQRAARSVFTMLHHLVDVAIARLFQLVAQAIARQLLSLFHHQRVAV